MSKAMFGFFVDKDKYYCCYCNQGKFITDFAKDRSSSKGFRSRCKECQSQYNYYWKKNQENNEDFKERNKDKLRTYDEDYRDRNIEKRVAYEQKYREKNKGKLITYAQVYREINKEKLKMVKDNLSPEKKEERNVYWKNYFRTYYKNNKEEIRKKHAQRDRVKKDEQKIINQILYYAGVR
jgi:hypothetical protein